MMTAWVTCLRRSWQAFWFAPGSAINLAAARIICATHALWLLLSRDPAAFSDLPAAFWADVPASLHWRYLLWEGNPQLEQSLQGIAIGALLAAILGIAPRSACFIAGLLLYHLAPLETIFRRPTPWPWGFTQAVLGLLILSFARCGDSLSLLHRRRNKAPEVGAEDYHWPLRLLQVFVCQIYVFPGYSKLVRGWWLSGENVCGLLPFSIEQEPEILFHAIGRWLAAHEVLCLPLAVGTVGFELAFVAILFRPATRPWLLTLALMFHIGVLLTLNIAFLSLPYLLIFVDWEAWRKRRWSKSRVTCHGRMPPPT